MGSSNRAWIYWVCQVTGWGTFVLGNFLMAQVSGEEGGQLVLISALIFTMGILITHTFRSVARFRQWSLLTFPGLIPRILLGALAMSVVFTTVNTVFTEWIIGEETPVEAIASRGFLLNIVNFTVLFLIWEMIYFAVKTFENWKREEIANLELRAAKTEIELNSFKSQMNPHFMFNSLNSIRALVDEAPDKAKHAITLLSGMLRHNLVLGKKPTVPLGEEMDLVEKYLSLEKIRFEERLQLSISVDPHATGSEVPPFMIQTIVENAIKHGISRREEGGIVQVQVTAESGQLVIIVRNSGRLHQVHSDGIGVTNTRKRIELLYGSSGSFSLKEERGIVIAELRIPQSSKA